MAVANSKTVSDMNAILNPYLFQVIGSTPESIRDSIKQSALKANPAAASKLAVACVFAAAVNKPTMENFIAKPEMADARPVISTTFSISGKANMTGLTLLGHCLLTTDYVNNITFCVEFRKKLGQDDLWSGNLESGSLSDKQKKILQEKKRVTPATSARLLGSGFFKFTGMDSHGYTAEEAAFWGERAALPAGGLGTSRHRASPSGPSAPSGQEAVPLADGSVVLIPIILATYYRTCISSDPARLRSSIAARGVDGWIADYNKALAEDPEMLRRPGTTVI